MDQSPVLMDPGPGRRRRSRAGTAGVLAAPMLAAIAGQVDATAYLTLHAFVANMTGAVVLLGIAAADLNAGAMLPGATAVVGFLFGVIASRHLRLLVRGPSASLAAAAFFVALVALEALSGVVGTALLAFAMGLQSAAATRFAGVSVNTAFLTGNIEHLGEALADRPSPVPGSTPPARIRLIGAVLAAYGAGAATGAAATRLCAKPLLVSAALLLAASLLSFRARERGIA